MDPNVKYKDERRLVGSRPNKDFARERENRMLRAHGFEFMGYYGVDCEAMYSHAKKPEGIARAEAIKFCLEAQATLFDRQEQERLTQLQATHDRTEMASPGTPQAAV